MAAVAGRRVCGVVARLAAIDGINVKRNERHVMGSVTLANIRKSFGSVEVLHGLDLGAKNGEFVVLVSFSPKLKRRVQLYDYGGTTSDYRLNAKLLAAPDRESIHARSAVGFSRYEPGISR